MQECCSEYNETWSNCTVHKLLKGSVNDYKVTAVFYDPFLSVE